MAAPPRARYHSLQPTSKLGRHSLRSISLTHGADDLDARGRSPMCRQSSLSIVRRRSRGSLPRLHLNHASEEIGAPVICRRSRATGSGDQPVGAKLPGRVTIFYRPVDRSPLRFEGGKDVVAVIFDCIIFDRRTLRPTLGTGLNVDVRHCSSPWIPLLRRVVTAASRAAAEQVYEVKRVSVTPGRTVILGVETAILLIGMVDPGFVRGRGLFSEEG